MQQSTLFPFGFYTSILFSGKQDAIHSRGRAGTNLTSKYLVRQCLNSLPSQSVQRRHSTAFWDKLSFNFSTWVPTILWKFKPSNFNSHYWHWLSKAWVSGFQKQGFGASLSHGRKKSKWSHRDVPVLIQFPAQQPNPGMKIKPKTQFSPVVTNKKCPLPHSPTPKKEAFRILSNSTGQCNQLLRRSAVNHLCLFRGRQHGRDT